MSTKSTTSADQEAQPLLLSQNRTVNLNFPHEKCSGICCLPRHICLQYKAILLILAWTVIVGELFSMSQVLIGYFITDYVPIGKSHLVNAVSSPMGFLYAILAVIAMFYPLSGFLADVCCGRFLSLIHI